MKEYKVKDNYKGNNKKVLRIIKIWETMTFKERLELYDELFEWNIHGF